MASPLEELDPLAELRESLDGEAPRAATPPVNKTSFRHGRPAAAAAPEDDHHRRLGWRARRHELPRRCPHGHSDEEPAGCHVSPGQEPRAGRCRSVLRAGRAAHAHGGLAGGEARVLPPGAQAEDGDAGPGANDLHRPGPGGDFAAPVGGPAEEGPGDGAEGGRGREEGGPGHQGPARGAEGSAPEAGPGAPRRWPARRSAPRRPKSEAGRGGGRAAGDRGGPQGSVCARWRTWSRSCPASPRSCARSGRRAPRWPRSSSAPRKHCRLAQDRVADLAAEKSEAQGTMEAVQEQFQAALADVERMTGELTGGQLREGVARAAQQPARDGAGRGHRQPQRPGERERVVP